MAVTPNPPDDGWTPETLDTAELVWDAGLAWDLPLLAWDADLLDWAVEPAGE